jgi:uncharacterized protein
LKADPFAQLKLLDIAEIDARVLQLRHQLANLPETAGITRLRAERKQVEDEAIDARVARDDLATAQAKAEKDVESVRTRRDKEQQRLDSGLVSNPKDIERVQSELANIDRRISVLEDEELEVMEQLETAQGYVKGFEIRAGDLDEQIDELTQARSARSATVEKDLAAATDERGPAIEGLPEDLLALYDRLRERSGVGAAELRARQCGGCRLTLDSAELITIKAAPSDEVVRHEDCGVILVRTAESGL